MTDPSFLSLSVALGLEITAGRWPTRWHPVGWMGRMIDGAVRLAPYPRDVRLAWGAIVVLVGSVSCALVAEGIVWSTAAAARRVSPSFAAPAVAFSEGLMLGSLFSIRGTLRAAREIERALAHGLIMEARRLLGRDLVSRPTAELDSSRIRSAVIESVAENTTDSVVAPLFWYLLFGLPGAVIYRFVNTADAMIGYRTPPYEALGKVAARTDDLLNWVPARLAALLIVLSAFGSGANGPGAFRIMCRDRARTESLNAGWTMSAMAGALAIRLEKPGCYVLGSGALPVDGTVVSRSLRLAATSMIFAAAAGLAFLATRTGFVPDGGVAS
jgi:adenosylcobinamide-phosphate synthase